MSVVFACGETEGFATPNGLASVFFDAVSAGQVYDSSYARGAIYLEHAGQIDHTLDTAKSEVWIHYKVAFFNQISIQNDDTIFSIEDAAAQSMFILNPTNGVLQAQYWDGAAFQNLGATFTWTSLTVHDIDVNIKIDASAGRIALYLDGALHDEVTGDTDYGTGIQVAKVLWLSMDRDTNELASRVYVSEVIITDSEQTLSWHLNTLPSSADGASTAWTGGEAEIDEVGLYDDADVIESASASASSIQTFVADNMTALTAPEDIKAVVVAARARRGITGPQNLQLALYTDGATNYFSSTVSGLDTHMKPFVGIWETDPSSGAAWTASEVNALEFGVKSLT